MLKAALNLSAPMIAVAGGELYGIGAGTLGTVLFVIMIFAVIINQVWAFADRVRHSIRNPEADFSALALSSDCGRYRREIGRTLDQLRAEDEKQDAANQKRFDDLDQSIKAMRGEMRDDIKGLHERSSDVLRAVSRLEGKVS
jgi:hypothetical protein